MAAAGSRSPEGLAFVAGLTDGTNEKEVSQPVVTALYPEPRLVRVKWFFLFVRRKDTSSTSPKPLRMSAVGGHNCAHEAEQRLTRGRTAWVWCNQNASGLSYIHWVLVITMMLLCPLRPMCLITVTTPICTHAPGRCNNSA